MFDFLQKLYCNFNLFPNDFKIKSKNNNTILKIAQINKKPNTK